MAAVAAEAEDSTEAAVAAEADITADSGPIWVDGIPGVAMAEADALAI